jgi:predicted acetyltransferase
MGFADGTWMLRVDDAGRAAVTASADPAEVTLTVNALSSIVLGGVRATTLRAAGALVADEATAVALDATFASPEAPYLSLWY